MINESLGGAPQNDPFGFLWGIMVLGTCNALDVFAFQINSLAVFTARRTLQLMVL